MLRKPVSRRVEPDTWPQVRCSLIALRMIEARSSRGSVDHTSISAETCIFNETDTSGVQCVEAREARVGSSEGDH